MLEWVPAGLNIGALSGAKASSSRTRDMSRIIRRIGIKNLRIRKQKE
jgi:hypothetical protein